MERFRPLAGLLVLLVLAAWLCEDWLLDASPLFNERDAGFSAVALAHLQGALLGHGGWADAPLGWPLGEGTTRADWMAGQAVLLLPARLAGVDPSRVYELASFVGLVLTAWAGYQLARVLVGPGPHAVLAGLVAGLGPLQLGHAAHANLVHHEVALLPALLLGAGLSRGRAPVAAAGGLAAGLAWHFGLYMGLHAALVTGAVVLGLAVTRRGTARAWIAAAAGLALALLTVVPVAKLYGGAATEGGVPDAEMVSGSWDLGTTFALTEGAWLHAYIGAASPVRLVTAWESPNPGYLVLALALVGLFTRGRPRGAWILVLGVAAIAAALALGSTPRWHGAALPVPGPHRLLEWLTGGNLRSPLRWLALVHVAIGLYASAGLAALAARLPGSTAGRWGRLGLTAGVLVVATSELPWRAQAEAASASRAYCLLDDVNADGALFEVFGKRCDCGGTSRLRATLFHGRPVVGGHYARYAPALTSVNQLLNGWPNPGALAFLRATQSTVLFEHPPLRGGEPPDATCTKSDGHRLCVLDARAPLPAPSAITTEPMGPVVGLRWPSVPNTRVVRVECAGRAPEEHPVDAWQVLAQVRGVDTFDVLFEAPCDSTWEVSDGTPVPLYLDPAHTKDTWLPPMPARGEGMAGMMGCDE
jgi:hypothetical protein